MQQECLNLSRELGLAPRACVSYAQLKRMIPQVDCALLNKINARFWGVSVENRGGNGYAIVGKELRGGARGVLGEKRGLNAVSGSQHTDNEQFIIDFYDGSKDSEKTVVRRYFESSACLKGKYSLDALPLGADLLETIRFKTGVYPVSGKAKSGASFRGLQAY